MKNILSWLQNTLRQVVIVFMLGLIFFGGQCFGYSNTMIAQADIETPEGVYYKGAPEGQGIENNNQVGNAQNKLRNTGNSVKDKLNLDEPTPKATKDFFKSVKGKVEDTVKPLTGNKTGYDQGENSSRR